MTTTTKPQTARRRLTQAQLAAEAVARFGSDPLDWRFRCPGCGATQCAADCRPGYADRVLQGCMACGLVAEEADGEAANGIVMVKIPGIRQPSPCFPLADEFDDTTPPTPQEPPHTPADGPGVPQEGPDADSGSQAPPVPSIAFLLGQTDEGEA
jgi:hypothetical protein